MGLVRCGGGDVRNIGVYSREGFVEVWVIFSGTEFLVGREVKVV